MKAFGILSTTLLLAMVSSLSPAARSGELTMFGKFNVVQNDAGNNATSVTVTLGAGSSGGITYSTGNRADYTVALATGNTRTTGALITSISQLSRNNNAFGDTLGTFYATSAAYDNNSTYAVGVYKAGDTAPLGGEVNINTSFGFFPYTQWIAGAPRNATPGTLLTTITGTSGLTIGTSGTKFINATTNGTYTLDINSFSANSITTNANAAANGVLLVCGASNDNYFANSVANANGTFTINCVDNTKNSGDVGFKANYPINFVYIRTADVGTKNLVAMGRVNGNATTDVAGGSFTVTNAVPGTVSGTWYLTIPGHTDSTGTLIISAEGGGSLNVDNIVSYAWDSTNSRWVIETRDLPGLASPQTLGATEDGFSFAFMATPAYVSPSFTGTAGSAVTDADSGTTGSQAAFTGTTAFSTISGALSLSALLTINSGTYNEALSLSNTSFYNTTITGTDTAQAVTVGSLASVTGSTLTIQGSSTLTFGNASNTVFNGAIVGGANAVLNKQGAGTFIQDSNSSGFVGTLNINAGSFICRDSTSHSFNAASIVVNNGGTFQFGAGGITNENPNLPNSTYITVNTGGTVTWIIGEDFGGIHLSGGTIDVKAGIPNCIGTTAQSWTSGTLSGTGASVLPFNGTVAINKTTTGTVIITGNVDLEISGSLNIQDGAVSHVAAANLGTSNITLGGASTAGTFEYQGLTASRLGTFGINAGGGAISVTNAAATLSLTGNFTGTGALTKSGAGTLALTGTSVAYSGQTNINAGTITCATIANGGTASSIGSGTSISFDGGTLNYTGATASSNRTITLAGAGTINVNASAATNLSLSGVISGSGSLTKTGPGMLTLSGANNYTGTTTISAGELVLNGSLTSNTTISSAATLTGGGANTGTLTVSGRVSPGTVGTTGILQTGSLSFTAGGILIADLTNTSAAGTGYDQLQVTGAGTVDLTNSTLRLIVPGSGLSLNDSFTLITGASAVTGQFSGGTTISAYNNALYVFTINYAGGPSGKDVVATVSTILSTGVLDVNGSQVTYTAPPGTDNGISVSIDGASNYVVSDAGSPTVITLTANASAAGWTTSGGVATGTSVGVTSLSFVLQDGSDSFVALNAGSANVSVSGTGTLTVLGTVTTTGAFAASQFQDILTSASGQIIATSVTLGSSNGIGSVTQSISTQTATIVANAAAGGVYLAEADGASVTATATGAGNISIVNSAGSMTIVGATSTGTGSIALSSAAGLNINAALTTTAGAITLTNTTGALATTAAITSTSGNISIQSGDDISVGANVNAGSGTITISANTDGVGAQGFDQKAATLTTTNTTATALAITINTALGGAGDAIIGQGNIGSATGGTITVISNGGNILWSNDASYTAFTASETGLSNGGTLAHAQTLRARLFSFNATGSGGVGTDSRPLQIDNFGPDGVATIPCLTASSGSGGVYITAWDKDGTNDLTTGSISATGSGNIRVVAANQGSHSMYVRGNVSTVDGNIFLGADDNLDVGPNVIIGGAACSGTIWMSANRDLGSTGQFITFGATASVSTNSTVNQSVSLSSRTPLTQAVYMEIGGGTSATSGIVQVGSITTGDGGRVVLNGSNIATPTQTGLIRMASATNTISVGATGTLDLQVIGIATLASNIGSVTLPISVAGGNVVVSDSNGNVFVTGTNATSFNAKTTTAGALNLTTLNGALTISGLSNTGSSAAVNLTGAGGVAINATLGSSTTGAIAINGALSGSGNITAGTGAVTVTQSSDSSYGGVISGNQAFNKAGTGALTLAGINTYSGDTNVNTGALLVASGGVVATTSLTTVANGATLGGSGSVGPITANGTVSPGIPGVTNDVGTLTATGNVSFNATGILRVNINSESSTDTDVLDLTGKSLNILSGAKIAIVAPLFTANATVQYQVTNHLNTSPGAIKFVVDQTDNATGSTASVGYDPNANTPPLHVYVNLGGTVTPVKIAEFSAKSEGSGVNISWTAVSEFQNAGFNIYRRELGSSDWNKVNPSLIAGRITNPDELKYTYFDWATPGMYEYKLESVSIANETEEFSASGSVSVDWNPSLSVSGYIDAGNVQAATHYFELRNAVTQAAAASKLINASQAIPLTAMAIAREKVAPRAQAATGTPTANSAANIGVRWFSASSALGTVSSTCAKVQYTEAGMMLIPKTSMPAGFDLSNVTLQREGRNLNALALTDAGLLVHAPGYQDDYTNKDTIFIRRTAAPTKAGQPQTATGLFSSAMPVNVTSPATVTTEYHDIYFDYSLRPYSFAPWFSSKYLTGGTAKDFTINLPQASSGPARLSINVWSLTGSEGIQADHALQVMVNGQPIGQSSWSGGGKMMRISLDINSGILTSGENVVSLVTPQIDGVTSQIALVHSLTANYTRALEGSVPFEITNDSDSPRLFEVYNVPAAGLWVTDTRFADRAALVPTESKLQADGTLLVRFIATNGGSGKYTITPVGQENTPLSVSVRQVKALKQNGTYLATGPAQFASGTQPLLMKRAKEGIRGAYIDQEQLFDYYNYGRYGPDGIRNAVRSVKPTYLLLVGRTTYDYLNYEGQNIDPLCPAYLVSTSFWAQTTSDSAFGDLGRGYPEVAVGRLPINNTTELAGAINHIVNYAGIPASGLRLHAVADVTDIKVANFGAQLDTIIKSGHPDVMWQENYFGTTFQTPQEVTEAMKVAANGGADLLLYSGHGNAARIGSSSPNILDQTSVQQWTGNTVFLQSTCTANWMAKNVDNYKSIAIQALTQPQGGISASIATSTYMNPDVATAFMNQLLKNANNGGRWGSVLLKAQQWAGAQNNSSYFRDLMNTEQLFGDPAMQVFAPQNRTNASTISNTVPVGTF